MSGPVALPARGRCGGLRPDPSPRGRRRAVRPRAL